LICALLFGRTVLDQVRKHFHRSGIAKVLAIPGIAQVPGMEKVRIARVHFRPGIARVHFRPGIGKVPRTASGSHQPRRSVVRSPRLHSSVASQSTDKVQLNSKTWKSDGLSRFSPPCPHFQKFDAFQPSTEPEQGVKNLMPFNRLTRIRGVSDFQKFDAFQPRMPRLHLLALR
jgi:hypothetical protein